MASDPRELLALREPMVRVLAMVPDLLDYSVTVYVRGMFGPEIVTVFIRWGDIEQRNQCNYEHFRGETEHDCWVKALAWFEERAAKEASDAT